MLMWQETEEACLHPNGHVLHRAVRQQ